MGKAMTLPDNILQLRDAVVAGKAPPSLLTRAIVSYVSRKTSRSEAIDHAASFVHALSQIKGAPRVSLWTKKGVRVYFPGEAGYLSFFADGTMAGESGTLTIFLSALYPGQKRAYREAVARYRSEMSERLHEHERERVDEVQAIQERLGVATPNPAGTFDMSVFDNFDDVEVTEAADDFVSLAGLSRGDVIKVGSSRWVVMRPGDTFQALVYKVPSKRTKLYEVSAEGRSGSLFSVFQVGGSGQRISSSIVSGPLLVTGERIDLDDPKNRTQSIKRRLLREL